MPAKATLDQRIAWHREHRFHCACRPAPPAIQPYLTAPNPTPLPGRVLMVRPAAFGYNPETAASNAFQQNTHHSDAGGKARAEFDRFVEALREANVQVEVAEDERVPAKPDAVFPNNWVTFHEGGAAILYPMAAPVRRLEVREDWVRQLGYNQLLDLRTQARGRFLEGTGSLVFDRANRLAFACESPRTDRKLVAEVCRHLGYEPVVFRATLQGTPIYHTNVLMSIGQDVAVVCLEVCDEPQFVRSRLEQASKQIIEVTPTQLEAFACNLLQLRAADGQAVWALSIRAYGALTEEQRDGLGRVVVADLDTIETLGGGSARCMLAELF